MKSVVFFSGVAALSALFIFATCFARADEAGGGSTSTGASAGGSGGGAAPPMNVKDFNSVAAHHPAGKILLRLFPQPAPQPPQGFEPTGLTKKDYLTLVAGEVDFWKHHLSPDGAILDLY
jgi:hypothetical protein